MCLTNFKTTIRLLFNVFTLHRIGLTAAETLGAPRVGAHDGGGVHDGDEAVGAREVRAVRLAALGNLADTSLAFRVLRVFDGGVVVRAPDGVALGL